MKSLLFRFSGFMLVLLILWVSASSAQEQASAEPSKPKAAAVTLKDVAWIAGQWQGEAMGGKFEETWNPPFAGSLMGMFKFAKNGKVEFYELLTIIEKDGTLLLRLKHFDKHLVGWEEKDKSVEFPFVRLEKNQVVFDGLRFKKIDKSTMEIFVKIKQGTGPAKELRFPCKRVVPAKK